ncbi:MAG: hypothetical protein ABI703_06490 [Gemmatimonadales bacterium]
MHSRLLTVLGVVAGLAITAAPLGAQEKDKMTMKHPPSQQATVTGTVVDVSCKFGQGLAGAEHRMCAQVCADKGIPLAILGDDGKLYLPTSPNMPGDGQNFRLKEFAEQRVTVSGKVFDAAGSKAIQISTVKKA